MCKVIHHPEAEAELIDAAKFCDERVPGLGEDFISEVGKATSKLVESSACFRIVEDDICRCFVKCLPFSILSRMEKKTIYILVTKHQEGNPVRWKNCEKGGRT